MSLSKTWAPNLCVKRPASCQNQTNRSCCPSIGRVPQGATGVLASHHSFWCQLHLFNSDVEHEAHFDGSCASWHRRRWPGGYAQRGLFLGGETKTCRLRGRRITKRGVFWENVCRRWPAWILCWPSGWCMEKELSLQLGGGVTQPGQMNAGDRYVFSLQLDPIGSMYHFYTRCILYCFGLRGFSISTRSNQKNDEESIDYGAETDFSAGPGCKKGWIFRPLDWWVVRQLVVHLASVKVGFSKAPSCHLLMGPMQFPCSSLVFLAIPRFAALRGSLFQPSPSPHERAQVGVKSLQQLLLSDATCISDGISEKRDGKEMGFCWFFRRRRSKNLYIENAQILG